MLKRATYKDMKGLIPNCEPFYGNSASGIIDDNGIYIVNSYTTNIAKIDTKNKKVLYFDGDFYSSTTSKIQNIIRKNFKF